MTLHDHYRGGALVLGCVEGLGAAWAEGLAAAGFPLVLVDLQEGVHAQAAAFVARGQPARAVQLDLAAPDLADALARIDDDLGVVVYNACASHPGPFAELPLAAKLLMLDVNARGPLIVSDWAVCGMRARGGGLLVLMSSLSGMQGSGFVATYAGTKAFNTVLGESLFAELNGSGVDVRVVVAGAMNTPGFLEVTPADQREAVGPMEPAAVVAEALRAFERPRRGAVFVPGLQNRLVFALLGHLPRSLASWLISRQTRAMFADRRAP